MWFFTLLLFLASGLILAIFLYLSRRSKTPRLPLIRDQKVSHAPVQTLVLDGIRVRYYDVGRGLPFVLVHGLGASSFCYRFLIPLLQPFGRVIAIDLPGFGQSEKSLEVKYDVESHVQRLDVFTHKMGLKNIVLIGSSLGGLICLHLARRRPGLIKKLILISPALFVRTFVPTRLLQAGHLLVPRFINELTLTYSLRQVLARHELIDAEMIKGYLDPLLQENASYALVESLRSLLDPRWTKEIQNFDGAPLILWGQKDRILPVRLAHQIAQHIRRAKIEIHPDGGHHIQEDDPVWVREKIVAHLNQGP